MFHLFTDTVTARKTDKMLQECKVKALLLYNDNNDFVPGHYHRLMRTSIVTMKFCILNND